MAKKSDLPFGSEFSPQQIDLPHVLELAQEHGGDPDAFEAALVVQYFRSDQRSTSNQGILAYNTRLSMVAYGIIDKNANLTKLGAYLHRIRSDDSELYETLAKHILLNLNGAILLQCIQDMDSAGESVTLQKLRTWLKERGIR